MRSGILCVAKFLKRGGSVPIGGRGSEIRDSVLEGLFWADGYGFLFIVRLDSRRSMRSEE